jgi:uncharacterized protein YcbK (DUF882 family)
MNLSKYFTEEEFLFSKTAIKHKIKNTWDKPEHKQNAIILCTTVLDVIREKFGAIKITSGYRCAKLNKLISGASEKSMHLVGKAADIFPLNSSLEKVYIWIKRNHKGGFAIKNGQFIHVDTGVLRTWSYA